MNTLLNLILSAIHYRPQTKLREGNVCTGVCDSVHRGGVSAPSWVPGPGGSLPGGVSGPGGCLVETPWTATAAGGTHPTGMHSCCNQS